MVSYNQRLGIAEPQERDKSMKMVFFEDGCIMTGVRACDVRRGIEQKMSYEPMRYWFRDCDEWRKAYKRYWLTM